MYQEKRNFARLTLRAKARIQRDDEVIEGEVENLSLKGVFVNTSRQMAMNERVGVTINHTLTPQALCVLKARVVRVTDLGMGLQFEKSILD